MYRLPQHILDNLRCCMCEGYLSSKPLVVKPENQQVCGKCFKLLPTEEKEKCVRQVGLEAVAEVLVFPCRYNTVGCGYTYSWCDEKDHEVECPYRSETLSITDSTQYEHVYHNINVNYKNEIKCDSEDISALFKYEVKSSSQSLAYSLNIKGNCDKTLSLKCENVYEEKDNVELTLEGIVSLKNPIESVHSKIKVIPAHHDNVYESIRRLSVSNTYCLSCRTLIHEEKYTCLFGHPACENCRGNMCMVCVKIMEKESKAFCKNFAKGCQEAFPQDELNRHQDNCKFNSIKCPLEPCNFNGLLPNLQSHLKQDHASKVYLNHDINRNMHNKDDFFIILCYDSIFKCVYFYYKTFVEFFVSYIGPTHEALKYRYEISVTVNGTILKKSSKCADWNNMMLEKGISFERKDLIIGNEKKLNFDIYLRVYQYKS